MHVLFICRNNFIYLKKGVCTTNFLEHISTVRKSKEPKFIRFIA